MRSFGKPQEQRVAGTGSRLVRGTAAYAAGAAVQRAMVFLLLPFFAGVLSPSEFGQIAIATTLAAAISVIAGLGLETAMFRSYIHVAADPTAARTLVNTVGGFGIAAPLALSGLFAVVIAPAIATFFQLPTAAVQLAMVGAGATAAATVVPTALLRAQQRLGDYLRLGLVQVAVTPLLTIYFVAVLGWGVFGWMLAYALGACVLVVRGVIILGHRWSMDFDAGYLRHALWLGLPLVPHALSHWGLSVSDRAILGAVATEADVGAYYVAFIASLPIAMTAIALSQATQPLYVVRTGATARVSNLRAVVTTHIVAIVAVTSAVALLAPSVCLLFLPPDYALAATAIPWLAAGGCLFGLYLIPMSAVALTAGMTQRVWLITALAALINIGLNLTLTPVFGVIAAAVNTVVGYGVLLAGLFLYMLRVCESPVPYEARRVAAGVLILLGPAAVAALITQPGSIIGFGIRTIVVIASFCVLAIGPFRGEVAASLRAIRRLGFRDVAP